MLQILDVPGKSRPKTPAGLTDRDLLALYEAMSRSRTLDQRMMNLQRQGRIAFFGQQWGQEAATLGAAWCLTPDDWIFPALRESPAALLRGYTIEAFLCQLLGNVGDEAKGRQQPCHYSCRKANYVSLSSPIATQLPQAVGCAMAMKRKRAKSIVLAYLGDGATSESDFHVAMNFAAVYRAPVVFVCANNQWAISVPASKQSRSESFAIKGVAYGIPYEQVDGNDVLAVYESTRRAVERARAGKGPSFIEAVTYRIGGHTTSDDPSQYRDEAEVEQWKKKDPIDRFRRFLEDRKLWSKAKETLLEAKLREEIDAAIAAAEKLPKPPLETIVTDVFAKTPAHLEEQFKSLLDERRRAGDPVDDRGFFPI